MDMADPTMALDTHRFCWAILGAMFSVVLDARFKWVEIVQMGSTTSSKAITELWKLFSSYGLPDQLYSVR